MGTPTFVWYPDGGTLAASREDTTLGEELTDLTHDDIRTSATQAVRIVCERFTTQALRREILSLVAHIARGEPVGFTRDPAKAWAGYATGSPTRGDTTLTTTGDVWYYAGSASLSSGDIIVVEGLGAQGKREWVEVDSVSGTTITLKTPLVYTYQDDVVMIRWEDYYPVLYRPAGTGTTSTILTHDRRLNYTLDVGMETDPDALQALYSETGGSTVLLGNTSTASRMTLQDAIYTGLAGRDYRGALRDSGGYVVV
jgi:hypothetical protein